MGNRTFKMNPSSSMLCNGFRLPIIALLLVRGLSDTNTGEVAVFIELSQVPLFKVDAEGRGIEPLNEAKNLSLVLAVLVISGLAFRVSSSPDDRFQLIHDYLVSFIRKKYGIDLFAKLKEALKQKELSNLAKEKAEQEKAILAVANRKAKQRVWIASIFLGVASVAAIGISIYAGKTFLEQQEAIAGTRLEREGSLLLKQFEFQELKTLVTAVRVGKELKGISQNRSLEAYPAVSPILALQNINIKIRERLILSQGHQSSVRSVIFSPDDKRIATSGRDGTARIWNLEGKEQSKLQGHQGDVLSVVFAPDCKRIATSGNDGTARIWDLQGRQIAEYQGIGFISDDFQFIATIPKDDQSIVKLWRIQTLDEMLDSACARLRPYLITNPDISESDKQLCET